MRTHVVLSLLATGSPVQCITLYTILTFKGWTHSALVVMEILRWITTVNYNCFCTLDSLMQHVLAEHANIIRPKRHTINCYISCVLLFHTIHLHGLDPDFTKMS